MDKNIILLILAFLLIVMVFVFPRLRMRRSFTIVIRRFRENNADDPQHAMRAEDLEIDFESKTPSLLRTGDEESDAARLLLNAGIIRTAEDGKLYLSEESLSNSQYSKYGEQKHIK
jgi:hypothetical protein